MKKIKLLVFMILLFMVSTSVGAEAYKTNTLISVNTKATVETDKFDYKNFYYDSNIDNKGNANIKFESIQNNTLSKIAVSINILLFDENQKNIGFLTYCTDKDISSDYAGFKLRANQVVPFNITVTSKYFAEGKKPSDVRYIAVRDENKYCQIGGYDNYAGLTMDEIVNGVEKETSPLDFLKNKNIIKYFIYILIGVVVFALLGSVLKLFKNSNFQLKRKPKPEVKEEKTVDLSYSDASSKDLDLEEEDNTISSGGIIQNMIDTADELDEKSEPEDMASIQALYNTINNSSEEREEEKHTSVEDIYSGLNDLEEQKTESKEVEKAVSIDDLYDSINQDDDDE